MTGRFNGQTMVVTGAAAGISKAIAVMAAGQGAKVVVADMNEEGGQATVDEIKAAGGQAEFHKVNLTSRDSIAAFGQSVLGSVGTVDILVNGAGWDLMERFLDSKPETWDTVLAINFTGPVHLCHLFAPGMVEKGKGKIVSIASDAGRIGSPSEAVYSGAKGGIISFTKTLARELARSNVNVNCVSPGPTRTALYYAQTESVQQNLAKVIPMRRVGEPDEVAMAVLFFASAESDYVTGQTLSVSGGMSMVC